MWLGRYGFRNSVKKGARLKNFIIKIKLITVKKAKELTDNQVSFELMITEKSWEYDRIYSVGMSRFGKKFYNIFFKSISKLLKDDGIFLLHTIE